MLLSSQKIRFEDLRSILFSDISGVYEGVGSPFQYPVRQLELTNLTNANLLISFDGIRDKTIIAGQSAKIYDYGSNRSDMAGNAEQPATDRVYVKAESALPTSGSFYITAIYLSEV